MWLHVHMILRVFLCASWIACVHSQLGPVPQLLLARLCTHPKDKLLLADQSTFLRLWHTHRNTPTHPHRHTRCSLLSLIDKMSAESSIWSCQPTVLTVAFPGLMLSSLLPLMFPLFCPTFTPLISLCLPCLASIGCLLDAHCCSNWVTFDKAIRETPEFYIFMQKTQKRCNGLHEMQWKDQRDFLRLLQQFSIWCSTDAENSRL